MGEFWYHPLHLGQFQDANDFQMAPRVQLELAFGTESVWQHLREASSTEANLTDNTEISYNHLKWKA